MKKKLLAILLSTISTISANDLEMMDANFNSYTPKNLMEVATNLSARAGIKHSKGEYKSAIKMYDESLKIRKNLGHDSTKGYATVVFLKTVAQHRDGNSCDAAKNIKEAIEIYKQLGEFEDLKAAHHEGLQVYQMKCEGELLSKN
jgi:tetratricopeptide (TPR) repeat protein